MANGHSHRITLLLLPVGPLCVGLLRFLLPYYTAPDNLASARAVAAHPTQENIVIWLGLVASLTLVPGILAAAALLARSQLRTYALALLVPGYLCLPFLLVSDVILWTGSDVGLEPQQTARILDGLHPALNVGLAVFVFGHVVGTVLLGVAFLRSRRIGAPLAWALIVSQPLHFLTTVVLGLAWVDLIAWSLTATAMGAVAFALLSRESPRVVSSSGPARAVIERTSVQQ